MKTFQEFLNESDEYAFLKKAAFRKHSHLMASADQVVLR